MPLLSRYASSCSMQQASRMAAYGEMRLPSIVRYGYPYFREGDGCDDACPFARLAFDAQAAVEGLDPVFEPPEARAALRARAPDAVIGHLDRDDAGRAHHADGRRGGACVLRDVREGLGGDVVDRDLDGHRQPLLDLHPHIDRERGALGERLERRLEAPVRQDGRMQAARQLAKLLERERELLHRGVQDLCRGP